MNAESRETVRDVARRPKHSIKASADYRWSVWLETGATIVHVGSSFDDASNTRKLGGYVLVDVRASIPVIQGVELYGRIENLFDERYETAFRYGTPGRAVYGGIRLNYLATHVISVVEWKRGGLGKGELVRLELGSGRIITKKK